MAAGTILAVIGPLPRKTPHRPRPQAELRDQPETKSGRWTQKPIAGVWNILTAARAAMSLWRERQKWESPGIQLEISSGYCQDLNTAMFPGAILPTQIL